MNIKILLRIWRVSALRTCDLLSIDFELTCCHCNTDCNNSACRRQSFQQSELSLHAPLPI